MRIKGYTAPPPRMISVPDPNDSTRSSMLPSLESYLQETVQQMTAGELDDEGESTRDWTDLQARQKLSDEADDRGSYLTGYDPDTVEPARTALIDKYVKVFRDALTPIPDPK